MDDSENGAWQITKYSDGPLPAISTYNPMYGMYNSIEITSYFNSHGHNCRDSARNISTYFNSLQIPSNSQWIEKKTQTWG